MKSGLLLLLCLGLPGLLSAQPGQTRRPADSRPRHNDARLAAAGIQRYESKHLILYSDIPAEQARAIPPVIDQAHAALEQYFGPLPPAPDGGVFQVTGYLIEDEPLFKQLGLVPVDLPPYLNGRHRGQEFWMYQQEFDYYRRHLAIHEFTHCFMTIMPTSAMPIWYQEGMAELFGTHHTDGQGKISFRVMPENRDDYAGWGRITLLQQEIAARRYLPLNDALQIDPASFLKNEPYAWSWAVCYFFDQHPDYQQRFRELRLYRTGTQFLRQFRESFESEQARLELEWALFVHQVQPGYDLARAKTVFRPEQPLSEKPLTVSAAQGWQSSGWEVQAGREYRLEATGRFTLAQQPKPWVADAGGISFRYFDNQPLGRLILGIRASGVESSFPLRRISAGLDRTFTAPATGIVYFRLNDDWSQLADNTGEVQVQLTPAP